MPHQAEHRTTGRHRSQRSGRHRAALTPPIGGERGRTTVLTAVLGATLVTGIGVAGGSAAAAAEGHVPLPSAAVGALAPVSPADLAPGKYYPRTAALPTHVSADLSAVAVKLKPHPVKPHPLKAAAAQWVNPNPTGAVTSCFGPRWGRMHEGVDLAAPDGTPIVAAGAGVVVDAGPAEGYGNAVLIDHGNGFLTHYGHLSKISVPVGQHVTAGQQIGNEGSTGHSTGPHLHFEVHQGYYKNPIEPTAWMHQHGVDIPGCAQVG